MKKKVRFVRLSWCFSGFAMLFSAFITVFKGAEDISTLCVPLGLTMLVTGGINVIIYIFRGKRIHGSHWMLADGLATALLSIFLIFNVHIEPAIMPFFFGVWELFSGVLKAIDSLELKDEKIKGWYSFTVVGCIEIISGVLSLLKPIDVFLGMHIVVAFILFVQGLGYLFKILIYPQIYDRHLLKSE